MTRDREGLEWEWRKWKVEINREVKRVGLSKWKDETERKRTLEWYREKREDKTVEHVIQECEKYDSDRMEIMRIVLTDTGCKVGEVTERSASGWMVLLLILCQVTSD